MDEYLQRLTKQFEDAFDLHYQAAPVNKRRKLLPCSSQIFRRWLYSAIREESLCTPETLRVGLMKAKGANTHFTIREKTPARYTGFSIEMKPYTLDNHPIVEDFRTLLAYLRDEKAISLTPKERLPEYAFLEMAVSETKLGDPAYIAHLVEVACVMGILQTSQKFNPNLAKYIAEKGDIVFIMKNRALFDQIVGASLRLASQRLNEVLALPVNTFNPEMVLNLVRNPIGTDAFFAIAYEAVREHLPPEEGPPKGMGDFLDSVAGMSEDDFSEDMDAFVQQLMGMAMGGGEGGAPGEMAMVTMMYFFGVAYDRYFTTPFGYYLKLLRPVYTLPFDFPMEYEHFFQESNEVPEPFLMFFAPCSEYYLTPLGLKAFDIPANTPLGTTYFEQALTLPLIQKLIDGVEVPWDAEGVMPLVSGNALTLKVTDKAEKDQWVSIMVPENGNLHALFEIVLRMYGLPQGLDYMFYPDESESPFRVFGSPHQPRTQRAADVTFAELSFQPKHTFMLVVNPPPHVVGEQPMKFAITVTHTHTDNAPVLPVVVRVSAALQEEW